MPRTHLLHLLSCLLFPAQLFAPSQFYFTLHFISHILVIYLADITKHSKILWLKIAAAVFACDCRLGQAQLGRSAGLASDCSCGCIRLANWLGHLGFCMSPVSRGAMPFACGPSVCSLQQGSQSFYVAAQVCKRQKQKPQSLRFKSQTGTVSPTLCSVGKQVTDPAQIQGDIRRHGSLGPPVSQTTIPHSRAI